MRSFEVSGVGLTENWQTWTLPTQTFEWAIIL